MGNCKRSKIVDSRFQNQFIIIRAIELIRNTKMDSFPNKCDIPGDMKKISKRWFFNSQIKKYFSTANHSLFTQFQC